MKVHAISPSHSAAAAAFCGPSFPASATTASEGAAGLSVAVVALGVFTSFALNLILFIIPLSRLEFLSASLSGPVSTMAVALAFFALNLIRSIVPLFCLEVANASLSGSA